MKKRLTVLLAGLILLGMTGLAQASLTTIGTASYGGADYKLIYDDDDTGYGGGGLVWLDYTHSALPWQNQVNRISGLGSSLTVTLNPGYTTDIDWTTGWRLPDTVGGTCWVYGYEGDPDGDGIYSYTGGYNLANSEMGHLYYEELGNLGYYDTSGDYQPGYGLQNTGDFDNLLRVMYWYGTEYAYGPDGVGDFRLHNGFQGSKAEGNSLHGLAVRSGQVSAVPVPGAIWLFGTGLAGLVALGRRRKGNRV